MTYAKTSINLSKKQVLFVSLLGIAAIIAFYWLRGAFSVFFFDDDLHEIGMGASVAPYIYKLFAMSYNLWYRPLAYLLLSIVYLFSGLETAPYHLVTLTLVILAAWGVYQLTQQVGGDRIAGLIAAALTAFNYSGTSQMIMSSMGAESAGGTMGFIWALYYYLDTQKKGKWGSIGLIVFIVLCAGFKELFLFIAPLCLIAEFVQPNRENRLRRQITVWATTFGLVLLRMPMQSASTLLTLFTAYSVKFNPLLDLTAAISLPFLSIRFLFQFPYYPIMLLAPILCFWGLFISSYPPKAKVLLTVWFFLIILFFGIASLLTGFANYQRLLTLIVISAPITGLALSDLMRRKALVAKIMGLLIVILLIAVNFYTSSTIIFEGNEKGNASKSNIASFKKAVGKLPTSTTIINYDYDYESMCFLYPKVAKRIMKIEIHDNSAKLVYNAHRLRGNPEFVLIRLREMSKKGENFTILKYTEGGYDDVTQGTMELIDTLPYPLTPDEANRGHQSMIESGIGY